MPLIRKFEASNWPEVWPILQAINEGGDVFSFLPETPEEEMRRIWVEIPAATFVAVDDDGRVVGTYYIKPNQPGLGAHVCNAGYAVASAARGQGVASRMLEHSLTEAVALGFRAMQFNMVIATNETAIRLWERHGFEVVGRLPGAFRHATLGYVDALVMYKELT